MLRDAHRKQKKTYIWRGLGILIWVWTCPVRIWWLFTGKCAFGNLCPLMLLCVPQIKRQCFVLPFKACCHISLKRFCYYYAVFLPLNSAYTEPFPVNTVSTGLSADEDHGRTSEEEDGVMEQSFDRQVSNKTQRNKWRAPPLVVWSWFDESWVSHIFLQ